MAGWQYRWFQLDPENALLTYFLLNDERDDANNSNQRVRGQVSLRGAVISPSDEDSRTFTVNCASGDILKLRASDARERQEWVDGLRAIVESHSQVQIFYFGFHRSYKSQIIHFIADVFASTRKFGCLQCIDLCPSTTSTNGIVQFGSLQINRKFATTIEPQ